MYLSKHIVEAIQENIFSTVSNFTNLNEPDYWAVHPGGVRIVEAVKKSLGLTERDIGASLSVLNNYGNMSSPTILFILKEILQRIESDWDETSKKIFACAFGPGINIEMISFSAVNTSCKRESGHRLLPLRFKEIEVTDSEKLRQPLSVVR